LGKKSKIATEVKGFSARKKALLVCSIRDWAYMKSLIIIRLDYYLTSLLTKIVTVTRTSQATAPQSTGLPYKKRETGPIADRKEYLFRKFSTMVDSIMSDTLKMNFPEEKVTAKEG
jgi:hypothetical protein